MNGPRSRASRRAFLVASTAGMAGLQYGDVNASSGATAKSTILFFLCGGASHLDMWDLKPKAPAEYRGPFKPIATTAPGVQLCEHLPLLAKQAQHLAVVNSVGASVGTNDHHAGYYYNLTGHEPDPTFVSLGNNRTPFADDWPFMGTVVASRRPPGALPNAVTLPHKPSRLPYTRPGQFAARLGIEHDPLYVDGTADAPLQFRVPSLELRGDMTAKRLIARQELLKAIDLARRELGETTATGVWSQHQQRALSLLASTRVTKAFDVASESERVRERYGETINGTSLLLARRLVEAGVPFITVFWMENRKISKKCKSAGGWDTHGNNFNCLKEHLLPEFDGAFSALVEDLQSRGLLDQTLLLVSSEMGRKPKIGDPRSGGTSGAGRDHWTHCMSNVFAGGGVQGGQTYGSSDRNGEYPSRRPVTPAHIAKTVYHAMGIADLQARDREGRPYNLLDGGDPIRRLF